MDIYVSPVGDEIKVLFDALKEIIHFIKRRAFSYHFKNHENNIAPDNYVHRAFPYCQTDNRMFKATKRAYLCHPKLKIHFCPNPSFTF